MVFYTPFYPPTARIAADRTAAHRKSDQRRDDLCAGGLRNGAPNGQRLAAALG